MDPAAKPRQSIVLRRILASLAVVVCAHAFGATQGGPIPVPLPLFPANNWWNTDVSNAPLDANSANFIAHIVGTTRVHPDWGGNAGIDNCSIYGFPYIIVDGSQPKLMVTFDPQAASESDGVGVPFYPIPSEAITQCGWIEQGPAGNVAVGGQDRHMLIVDKTNNELYELYNVFYNGTNWTAYSGAHWDMKTNAARPDGWTSADAAGLQVLPGLVRYDEVYGPNEITHAFRFTVHDTNGHVFPATHQTDIVTGALPMGGRLRLKSTFDISTFPADVRKILKALKKYGLIVADNGSNMYIQGNYDTRWDMNVMNSQLGMLTANDFEVVQQGWKPTSSYILALPSIVGSGDALTATLTAYDASYSVATGYRGTVHFTSTDASATLPVDYTFTAADNGAHAFSFTFRTAGGQTVYATDAANATITSSRNVVVGPNTPTSLSATATNPTNVDLRWNPSSGVSLQYEIQRSSDATGFATVTTTAATSFSNSVAAGGVYVYRVRAIDASSRPSPFSIPDVATTISFTDDPLVAGTTPVKATHVTELRQAFNLLRADAGLQPFTFTNSSLAGVAINAMHLQQLRTALSDALSSLGIPPMTFTDSTITAGSTLVKATHFQELRDALK